MAKIDFGKACDSNEIANYLDGDNGGGTGGVTQQYVDDQDAIVQANVDAEAVTREEADTALQTQIDAINAGGGTGGVTQQYVDDQDAIVQANVDAEAVTREEADTALQDQIDAINAGGGTGGVTQQYVDDQDAIVQANVDAEAVMRAEADTALQTSIATEVTDRTDADTLLQTNIDAVQLAVTTEVTDRTDADTLLQTNIDAVQLAVTTEVTDRTDADTNLQSQIDALGSGGGSTSTNEDVFYTVTGDADVDCSTIPDGYNAIEIDLTTMPVSLNIYNLATSNIRYIKATSNVVFGATIIDDPSLVYADLSLQDLQHTLTLFPNSTSEASIYTFFIPKGAGVNVLTWQTLYFIKQRESLFFIRFNNDLTYLTEYFNTDEFLIPFLTDGSLFSTKWLYIHQPTTIVAGAPFLETVMFANSVSGMVFASSSYLLQAPIHSPCIGVFESGIPKDSLLYLESQEDMVGSNFFTTSSSGTDHYMTPSCYYVSNDVYRGGVFPASALKNLIAHFRVLTVTQYMTAEIHAYISIRIFNTLYTNTMKLVGAGNQNTVEQKEEMGFHIGTSTPHALTSVSYFDKMDEPIPTGYVPVPNEGNEVGSKMRFIRRGM